MRAPTKNLSPKGNHISTSNESIFERIARGDQTAVAQCLDEYGGLVWSIVLRWVRNSWDAEDITQEIFLELWKCADRYNPEAGSEQVFVSTIARRRLIDRLRSQGRRPTTEEYHEETHVDENDRDPDFASVAFDVERATEAIEQLGDGQREILTMGVVAGMTHSEIAAATGKPLGTVKTQIRRGLIKVRELIERGTPGEVSQ